MYAFRSSRTRWWLQFAVLALVGWSALFMLGRTVWQALAMGSGQASARASHSIPNTDVNPFGANFFLAREVEPWKIDKTLEMASEAGIGWVKQHFPWEDIEPKRKGEFIDPTTKADAWAKYDRIVEACERHDLRIIARLDRPPDWTRQDNTYQERPPDNLEDYGDFVYAFCERYRGRVDYIQVWNEPNIFPEWGNRPVDPEGYVDLLEVAYRRAKEANPHVFVLSAPLAITLGQPHPEPGKWIAMSDLEFLEAMYEAGAADYFDIYSANAFGMDRPPNDPADPTVLNFQRVLLQREIMVDHGDEQTPVWFNEYAWNAAPESMPAAHRIWQRVSEQEQAEYTLQGIEIAQSEWPWAGVFNIWYFRQVGSVGPDRADYYFRMVDPDFTPRRLYLAVQEVAGRPESYGPGRYQETSLNVTTFGAWRNQIAPRASDGALFASQRPGASVTFAFEGSHVDLITRVGPEAGRLEISLDGKEIDAPESDSNATADRGHIELYATETSHVAVPIIRDASPGRHTVRLTVAASRNPSSNGSLCAIDAFEVLEQGTRPFPWLPSLAYCAVVAASALGLLRTRRHLALMR